MPRYQGILIIRPVEGRYDSQADNILRVLHRLGFSGTSSLRFGNAFTITLTAKNKAEAQKAFVDMGDKLRNPSIRENFFVPSRSPLPKKGWPPLPYLVHLRRENKIVFGKSFDGMR